MHATMCASCQAPCASASSLLSAPGHVLEAQQAVVAVAGVVLVGGHADAAVAGVQPVPGLDLRTDTGTYLFVLAPGSCVDVATWQVVTT